MHKNFYRSANRSFRGLLLILILFSLVFYGCDSKKKSENPDQNKKLTEVSSSESKKTDKDGITEKAAADILARAPDTFTETFKEGERPQNPDLNADLDVDTEVQNKFLSERKLTLLPKVEKENSPQKEKNSEKKYLLTYKFNPNTVLRWEVTHEVNKKVLLSAKTNSVKTFSKSKRRWEIKQQAKEEKNGGKFVCLHTIEEMQLKQQNDERKPVVYDSRTDKKVPRELAVFGTDKTIGKVLERFIIDGQGMMTEKHKLVREYHGLEKDSKVLVPFPNVPIEVGASWTVPILIFLKGRDNNVRTYQATEKFTLEAVEGDLAIIRLRTIFLSVATDPVILGQLAERLFTGRAVFDMKRGMTLKTELEYADSVTNAMGDSSHLDYRCRVVEKLITD